MMLPSASRSTVQFEVNHGQVGSDARRAISIISRDRSGANWSETLNKKWQGTHWIHIHDKQTKVKGNRVPTKLLDKLRVLCKRVGMCVCNGRGKLVYLMMRGVFAEIKKFAETVPRGIELFGEGEIVIAYRSWIGFPPDAGVTDVAQAVVDDPATRWVHVGLVYWSPLDLVGLELVRPRKQGGRILLDYDHGLHPFPPTGYEFINSLDTSLNWMVYFFRLIGEQEDEPLPIFKPADIECIIFRGVGVFGYKILERKPTKPRNPWMEKKRNPPASGSTSTNAKKKRRPRRAEEPQVDL